MKQEISGGVLDAAMGDVRAFHGTFGHPAPSAPAMQPPERAYKRADWIEEEVCELRGAPTLVDQADAYLDIIYFAVGGLVELGIDPSPLWNIVQRANMAKVQPDGSVKRREDGKIVKPADWVAPEPLLEAEVARQIAGADGRYRCTRPGCGKNEIVARAEGCSRGPCPMELVA